MLTNIGADVLVNIVWKGRVCEQRECAVDESLCSRNKRRIIARKDQKRQQFENVLYTVFISTYILLRYYIVYNRITTTTTAAVASLWDATILFQYPSRLRLISMSPPKRSLSRVAVLLLS